MFFITTLFTHRFKLNNYIHLIYKTVNTLILKNCNKSNQITVLELNLALDQNHLLPPFENPTLGYNITLVSMFQISADRKIINECRKQNVSFTKLPWC